MFDKLYNVFVFKYWSKIAWKSSLPKLLMVYNHVGEIHLEIKGIASYLLSKSPYFRKNSQKIIKVYMLEIDDEKFKEAKYYLPSLSRIKNEINELDAIPTCTFNSVALSFVLESMNLTKEEKFEYILKLKHLLKPAGIIFGISIFLKDNIVTNVASEPNNTNIDISSEDLKEFLNNNFRKSMVYTYGACTNFWADIE